MESFDVRLGGPSDLASILGVQRRAFGRVARQFGLADDALPPLRESLEDLVGLQGAGTVFFVAYDCGGRVMGSVRATVVDSTVEVGRLVVDDGWERQGAATALMDAVHERYSEAARFELFTAAAAVEPLALYAKLGYTVFRRKRLDEGYEMIWLEKTRG